jgi:hypothetical protein
VKPYVQNAADESQVKDAAGKSKRASDREIEDLRYVLTSAQGRRFLWRLMGHCKVNASVWEPSAKIHYNSGQQDVGHYLMAEVVRAGEDFLFQMMKEAKQGELANV